MTDKEREQVLQLMRSKNNATTGRPVFRTNDVPDPYAEGPQSAAEPYCSKNINAESEWLKGYYIPIGGTRPGPGAGHSIDPSKPGPDDLAQSDAESFEYCPICGKDEDHEHGNADVDAWLKTQSDAEPGAMK